MKFTNRTKKIFFALAFFIFFPSIVFAHQPRIVADGSVVVPEPEISKAYYDELAGKPRTYLVSNEKPFKLYVGITVPKSSNPDGRFSARIYHQETGAEIALLDGSQGEWTEFFEPFGYDAYLEGPEFVSEVPEGTYEVQVFNEGNQGKYVLAIGRVESFPPIEILRTLRTVPKLKRTFFNVFPGTFLFSPFGAIYAGLLLLIGLLVAYLHRLIMKRFTKGNKNPSYKNIGKSDRIGRFVIFIILFLAGLYFWIPILYLAAGYVLYEVFAGWCGFYAIIGRNTCPIKYSK